MSRRPFWESGLFWLVLCLVSMIPFLFITVLPFNDLSNHVGRHHVFLNWATDPFLRRYYDVHWHLIGNLGVDIPVALLGPWLGAERSTHVVVSAIPPLTIAGIYALTLAINGRVQPASLVAVPLAYNWPFITGFANFCLAAALALLVIALWIRLRHIAFAWRLILFTPLGFGVWVCHTAGWGLLSLGVGAYEIARATSPRIKWKELLAAPLQATPFALMIVFTLLWRQSTSNGAAIRFGAHFAANKLAALASLFREHYFGFDLAVGGLFFGLLIAFFLAGGRRIVWPAAVMAAAFLFAFLVCPQEVFKSGFADRRLLTYGAIMLPLAIGTSPARLTEPRKRRTLTILAVIAVAAFLARVVVSTSVWSRASRAEEKHLALIDAVPLRSRIFGLVVEKCGSDWNRVGRPDHLQQYALIRRRSVINGMFQNPGLNQVEARFGGAPTTGGVDPNMYAVVHDQRCPVSYIPQTFQAAMAGFPRSQFDYVWIIGEEPLRPYDEQGLTLIASNGNDRLYRVSAAVDRLGPAGQIMAAAAGEKR